MQDLIMKLLGYESVKNIKVPKEYKEPSCEKMNCKIKFLHATGKFVDKIIINNNKVLLDGYTTFLICQLKEIKYVKVIRLDASVEEYLKIFKHYRVQRKTNEKNKKKRRIKHK